MLRINARYLDEFVAALHLCPFARYSDDRFCRTVFFDLQPNAETCAREIARVADKSYEVVLLIFPLCQSSASEFEQSVAQLRSTTQRFAMAPFHPDAPYSLQTPEQLVPLFRRAPDPTIQLVRFSVLDAVKAERPSGTFLFDGSADSLAALTEHSDRKSVSEEVAHNNFATATQMGVTRLEALLADVMADRARSYARFRS